MQKALRDVPHSDQRNCQLQVAILRYFNVYGSDPQGRIGGALCNGAIGRNVGKNTALWLRPVQVTSCDGSGDGICWGRRANSKSPGTRGRRMGIARVVPLRRRRNVMTTYMAR